MKFSLKTLLVSLPLVALTMNAAPLTFFANLDGPSEPTNSLGTGIAFVIIDPAAHTMAISASFSGLTGTTTASHIHGATAVPYTGTAGVMTTTPTFAGFPLGVTSGTYINTLNTLLATSYNPAFLNNATNGGSTTTAEATMFAAIMEGRSYFNIHTSVFGGGEIRGFLQPVPEPSTMAVMGIVLAGLVVRRVRRAA